uniref:Polyadenylate-binding protein-interacting protein 2B isoform X2 n=1 Tax=Phascolarctos cinereus TaxID=38626 RepID=A0A6P5LEH2_PHACI|nr:polyadenylate-binding protein-interacting protein 2B isoform X2 [Phascolarctos cinereus]
MTFTTTNQQPGRANWGGGETLASGPIRVRDSPSLGLNGSPLDPMGPAGRRATANRAGAGAEREANVPSVVTERVASVATRALELGLPSWCLRTKAAGAVTATTATDSWRAEKPLLGPDSLMMNGSNVANTTPNAKSKEDQVVNGRDEKENNPFAEYMWMENEEDFNRQVEEELEEQEFLDRCFQEMLDEEDQDWFIPSRDLPQGIGQLQQQLNGLAVSDGHTSEDILSKSNLNPDAKEFIPGVKY